MAKAPIAIVDAGRPDGDIAEANATIVQMRGFLDTEIARADGLASQLKLSTDQCAELVSSLESETKRADEFAQKYASEMTTSEGIAEHAGQLENSLKEMTLERDNWMETARQHCSKEFYYGGQLDLIGSAFGPAAFTADDGTIGDSVLRAKVPELVSALLSAAALLPHPDIALAPPADNAHVAPGATPFPPPNPEFFLKTDCRIEALNAIGEAIAPNEMFTAPHGQWAKVPAGWLLLHPFIIPSIALAEATTIVAWRLTAGDLIIETPSLMPVELQASTNNQIVRSVVFPVA
jgi:hypothetical protein